MSEHPRSDRLETSYRRLLALYPREYRAQYGEEMIGVLMLASPPGWRRPGLVESLDLILSGLRMRLNVAAGGGRSPATRSAATVFGFLTAVVPAALSWYEVAAGIAWRGAYGAPVEWWAQVPLRSVVVGVGWTVAAGACLAGLRWVAALGAVAGFLGEAVLVGREYASHPNELVSSWWLLILAACAATCLVALTRTVPDGDGERRDPERLLPLGRRAVLALAVDVLLIVIGPFVERALTVIQPSPDGKGWMVHSRVPELPLPGPLWRYGYGQLGAAALVVTLVVLVLRLSPAVRRRVLLLAIPFPVTALQIQFGFQGFMLSAPTVHLTIGQWAALVLVPVLVVATGAGLLHWYERKRGSASRPVVVR